MRRLVLIALLVLATPHPAPAAEGWTVHHGNGTSATTTELAQALRASDVIFVGEQHNDAQGHAFEAYLLDLAHRHTTPERTVTLSLEMFERDVQPVLDEYLADLIREEDFLAASRPWPNYKTDYRPLVEFARTHDMDVLAANVPRRYASRASRLGLPALRPLPATWLPPLPVPPPSAAFTAKFRRFMGEAGSHAGPHMADGQVLKDATMAHAIAQHARLHPRTLIVHVNGAFHSEGGLGVPEMLTHYAPRLKRLVVTMNPEGDGRGNDFVVRTTKP